MKDSKLEDTHVAKGNKLVSNSAQLVILKNNRCKGFLMFYL